MNTELNMQIREAVVDGLDYIKRVQKNIGLLTNELDKKDKANIDKNYKDLKEGLQWISDLLKDIGTLLNIDYKEVLICKQGSDKIINNYVNLLNDIDELYNKKEYSNLSVLIKEELPKQLKKITSVFNKVKNIMNEREH